MDTTLLDALLGFALAYSATYVLYCWVHAEPRARNTREPAAQPVAADIPHRHSRSSNAV
ncbi:MAG TPA: hypothetical protein VNT02_05705 [Burkholderiales bacterium]|nr:hypothetical protein [Burkholderiales bacterium]